MNKIVFFIKNVSVAKEKAFLRTLAKKFSKNPHIRSSDFKNHEKIYESFERKITFLQMFLRTCKMQLWPPCRNYLDKTLQTFCWNSENDEKLIRFPGNLLVNLFIWTCTMKFRQACREILGKNTKNTPKIHKRWIYILSNKIDFFHQKGFFSNGECNFDNASKNFSLRIYRFAAQIPKTTKKIMNPSKGK